MTSTNINFLEQAVSKFKSLNADDRLAVLALLYTEISDEVPAIALKNDIPNDNTCDLVAQVQKLPEAEQLFALRQLINPEEKGDTTVPIQEYASMNTEMKLAFWYHLAQNLGTTIICVPDDYIPSEQATEVLDLLDTPDLEKLVNFLKQVL